MGTLTEINGWVVGYSLRGVDVTCHLGTMYGKRPRHYSVTSVCMHHVDCSGCAALPCAVLRGRLASCLLLGGGGRVHLDAHGVCLCGRDMRIGLACTMEVQLGMTAEQTPQAGTPAGQALQRRPIPQGVIGHARLWHGRPKSFVRIMGAHHVSAVVHPV